MKRYEINPELKESINKSGYSLRKLTKLLGFEVKNLLRRNKSIREDHLQKLTSLLGFNLELKERSYNPCGNLGLFSETKPIKRMIKGEKLAELIGILLGDGNIYENQIRIYFDKINLNLIF